jgi:hypothetical protein
MRGRGRNIEQFLLPQIGGFGGGRRGELKYYILY